MLPGADKKETTVELVLPLEDNGAFADRLKSYRKQHGLTQEELAKRLDVKHTTLRSWEQKKAQPPYPVRRLLARLLDDASDLSSP